MASPENTTSKKHVFMVVNTYAPDDPRVIFSATSLAKSDYDVLLCGVARQKNDEFIASQQLIHNVNVRILPHLHSLTQVLTAFWILLSGRLPAKVKPSLARTNILSMLLFNLQILRMGLFRPIDVIHCHDLSPLPACWLLSRLKRTKLIYDIHENVPTMYANRKGKIMTWLERRLVPATDCVISAGERLATAMLERGAKKVVHIGNWKKLEDYAIPDADVQALRQQYNIPENAIVISFLGTLDKNRQLPELLDAVASSPDVYLMIAGRGDYRELVIEYAKKHSNIIWLNWISLDELPLYTLAADVLYYCRTDDMPGGSYDLAPAPNKLYEAFAAELPVIARRNVGEVGEILENVGAGILLESVSAETIKSALDQYHQPGEYAEKQASARRAKDRYNWSIAEQLLKDTYSSLLRS